MLFHVTITHSQQDCPGRRPEETPELIGPADRLEALGSKLSVTAHSVVWGASCILWAEPEHVAYALLEAASLESVEGYINALTPAGWATRVLPVFTLPGQLAAVRQLLAAPAPFVRPPPAPATEPPNDRDTDDTLNGLTGGDVEQAGHQPVNPQSVSSADRGPSPDSGAATGFFETPAALKGFGSPPRRPDQPDARSASVAPNNEPCSPSESSTVILQLGAQGMAAMRLVASAGPAYGSVFDVGEAGATLGRLPDNSICLTDGRLSRHHARIEFRDGGYWLSDLGSQNGTLVNNHLLSEARRLQAGDSIELGTTRLTVTLDPAD
jgi:hypothetical protein